MKKIMSLAMLIALCIPAMAIDMPDMVGNWTGTVEGIGWLKNTNWQASGEFAFWEGERTMVIDEQNGTRIAGKIISSDNPMASEVVIGVICPHNDSITMTDEDSLIWADILSPTEIEIFYQTVGPDSMSVACGILTKE